MIRGGLALSFKWMERQPAVRESANTHVTVILSPTAKSDPLTSEILALLPNNRHDSWTLPAAPVLLPDSPKRRGDHRL